MTTQGTATNEKQVLTKTGSPTGGDFTASLPDGDPSSAIAHNADAAAVKTALVASDDFAGADLTVTGAAGGPWTIEFTGAYATQSVPKLEVDAAGLTGGTSPDVSVVRTVPGRGADSTNSGAPMLPGDPSEPQGPEDALGPGSKRGDYSGRGDGSTHFEGGVAQSYGPFGDHSDDPDAKGGVTTT